MYLPGFSALLFLRSGVYSLAHLDLLHVRLQSVHGAWKGCISYMIEWKNDG